jgi:transcriptional regulator with AAA-type ATPase domain
MMSQRQTRETVSPAQSSPSISKRIDYFGAFPLLEEVDELFFNEAMQKAQGNQVIAAQLLGVSPSTISRWQNKRVRKVQQE